MYASMYAYGTYLDDSSIRSLKRLREPE